MKREKDIYSMGRVPIPLARSRPQSARGYQPTQPRAEQNPPQSVSGIIPYGQHADWDHYGISNPEVIAALKRNGYQCEPYYGSDYWHYVNPPFEHGVPKTLQDGTTLIQHGASLRTLKEHRAGTSMWDGRVTTREAADALMSAFGGSYRTGIDETYAMPQDVGCVDYEEL